MKMIIIKSLAYIFLSVLAGDLLYLYYAGGWHDPMMWIEISEVVLLYIFVIFGVVMTMIEMSSITRRME